MSIDQEALFKLTRARIALITEQPFWGALALRLRLVENNALPTLAVDGKSVFYNAEFINSLSASLCKSAVAHEVGHCVFEHIARRGDRNPGKWNRAGDYVINGMLEESNFELGEGWLNDPAFKNMSADHVYSLLPDSPGGGGGGTGQPGGALCDIMDADVTDDASSVDEWKLATVQAATAAKQAGKLPGSMERFIKEMLNPKADWRSVLRRFVNEKTKNDYSWQRPNKRFVHAGFYLPTLYSESMGTMVVVTDDSGSIGDNVLSVFGAETASARAAAQPEKTFVISCDARVNHVDELDAYQPLHVKCHGGGGTDFRPPFAWLDERGIRPACLLYLTDGYGPFPDKAPDYPVLWCMTTDVQPPWGEVVEIEV